MKIICLGKTKQDFIQKGIEEYSKRLSSYIKIEWKILDDVKLTSSKNIEFVKAEEAKILEKHLNEDDFVILLDENGKMTNSTNFSRFLEKKLISSQPITFLIGGVYGVSNSIKKKADLILSYSHFTFTHQMIRLLLSEQLYRAFTIIKGKKYHY